MSLRIPLKGAEITCTAIETQSDTIGIESWPLELSSFDSVRSFVNKFEANGCTVDALIANAGVSTMTYEKTLDGYETT
jgi:short-subunit dehydrogenase